MQHSIVLLPAASDLLGALLPPANLQDAPAATYMHIILQCAFEARVLIFDVHVPQ